MVVRFAVAVAVTCDRIRHTIRGENKEVCCGVSCCLWFDKNSSALGGRTSGVCRGVAA